MNKTDTCLSLGTLEINRSAEETNLQKTASKYET